MRAGGECAGIWFYLFLIIFSFLGGGGDGNRGLCLSCHLKSMVTGVSMILWYFIFVTCVVLQFTINKDVDREINLVFS